MGLAEKSVLLAYHPDAEDWINVNNDLEKLLLELRDPGKRFARQVAPAAARRVSLVQSLRARLPCLCTFCVPCLLASHTHPLLLHAVLLGRHPAFSPHFLRPLLGCLIPCTAHLLRYTLPCRHPA